MPDSNELKEQPKLSSTTVSQGSVVHSSENKPFQACVAKTGEVVLNETKSFTSFREQYDARSDAHREQQEARDE